MTEAPRVLLVGFGSGARALAGRLLLLHLRGLLADNVEQAQKIAAERSPTAALIHSDCVFEAEPLRSLATAGEQPITLIASGPRPGEPGLAVLREADVKIVLFEPFGDGELRFVLNRALHGDHNLRREVRVPATFHGTVRSATGERRVNVYNLSAGGAYLETLRPTAEGGSITLHLPLPLPSGGVDVPARVVSTNVPGNLSRANLPMGMGVQFVDPPSDARRVLSGYVEQRKAEFEL
jgi:hypothetical protein